jgi:hypothetical protein
MVADYLSLPSDLPVPEDHGPAAAPVLAWVRANPVAAARPSS